MAGLGSVDAAVVADDTQAIKKGDKRSGWRRSTAG